MVDGFRKAPKNRPAMVMPVVIAPRPVRSVPVPAPVATPAAQVPDIRPAQAVTQFRPAAAPHPHVPATKIHARPQRSQTLMRNVVSKPVTKTFEKKAPIHHGKTAAQRPAPDRADVQPASQPARIERLQRANSVSRSRLVSKFGSLGQIGTGATVEKTVQPLAVQPAPAHPSAFTHTFDAPATQHHFGLEVPAHIKAPASSSLASHVAPRHKVPAHHRAAHKMRVHPRVVNLTAASLVGLLLLGFLAYQNSTVIAMKVANDKAGVQAVKPGFAPTGFAMQKTIEYAPGAVTMSFMSPEGASYRVTQQESPWNSDALFANRFQATETPYQVHSQNGQTIYTYGNGNATWVSGGMLYDIKGESSLGNEELLRIASSL
jgi:hypothetical protein